MSNGRWLTEEDVMLDLAVASGQLVGGLNEKFIVVGERPPQINKDEEEMEEMQNWCEQQYVPKTDRIQPDLSGITKMLRMVEDYSTLETSPDEPENLSKLRDSANNAVVISKLNPNVPEFKPSSKMLLNSHKDNHLSINNNIQTVKAESETPIEKSNNTTDLSADLNVIKNDKANVKTDCDIIDVNKRLDVSKLEEIEKEKLRENLKTKISNTSNTNCVKVKRQRNLAIATLMKLCSQPVFAAQQPETKPIKLMTPQDFENPLCDNKQEDISEASIELKKDELISQEEVKQSVDKVNKWLKGPEEKTKSQTLFLGPITFKRKETTKSSASPTITDDTNDSISDFKPSNYATQLSEKYKKRLEEKEATTDIWTKLEMDLKAKDEIIKKQNSSASTISDSETVI